MPALRFLLALAVTLLLHFVVGRIAPEAIRVVDLFLLLVVFFALKADLLVGMAVGVVAGLVTDAVTGGLYGLHGFADTIVGYGTAFAAQRLVIRRPPGVFLMFSLAAAAQQAVLAGLVVMLLSDPVLPELQWTLTKVVATGLLGVVLVSIRQGSTARFQRWRSTRTSKLK